MTGENSMGWTDEILELARNMQELKEYRELGTVEELRQLVSEKQEQVDLRKNSWKFIWRKEF